MTLIIINLKRRNYNDNIYEYSRHLKLIKYDNFYIQILIYLNIKNPL